MSECQSYIIFSKSKLLIMILLIP